MSRRPPRRCAEAGRRTHAGVRAVTACIAAGALGICHAVVAAPVTVEWTGTVRSVSTFNFPPDSPLFREVGALVAAGDSARYRLTYDDQAVIPDPDSLEPDPFEPRAFYSGAVTGFEVDLGTLSIEGNAGRIRVSSSPNRRERGTTYLATVTHDVVPPQGASLAGTDIQVASRDITNGNDLDGDGFGVELADAIGILLLVPDNGGPDTLFMDVDLSRETDGEVSNATVLIDFDASSIAQVPLPPALALFMLSLFGLWRFPRSSKCARSLRICP